MNGQPSLRSCTPDECAWRQLLQGLGVEELSVSWQQAGTKPPASSIKAELGLTSALPAPAQDSCWRRSTFPPLTVSITRVRSYLSHHIPSLFVCTCTSVPGPAPVSPAAPSQPRLHLILARIRRLSCRAGDSWGVLKRLTFLSPWRSRKLCYSASGPPP